MQHLLYSVPFSGPWWSVALEKRATSEHCAVRLCLCKICRFMYIFIYGMMGRGDYIGCRPYDPNTHNILLLYPYTNKPPNRNKRTASPCRIYYIHTQPNPQTNNKNGPQVHVVVLVVSRVDVLVEAPQRGERVARKDEDDGVLWSLMDDCMCMYTYTLVSWPPYLQTHIYTCIYIHVQYNTH